MKILVVGAGPTGLTMASELYRHGLPCRIIDASPQPCEQSRALGIHARSLEVFEFMGTVEPFLQQGFKLSGVSMFNRGEKVVTLALDELDSPYSFLLSLPQSETERILAAHLESFGARPERSVKLVELTQTPGAVTVTLEHPDGERETDTFDWIIGCDGAHSQVRHSVNASFDGSQYREHFVLADVEIRCPTIDFNQGSIYLSEEGMMAVLPFSQLRGRVLSDLMPEALKPSEMADEPTSRLKPPAPTLEQMQDLVNRRGPANMTIGNPAWLATFAISQRQVKQYRHGRVFLAGDAAHIHSPAGGQGMNTGIQDAFNLAWKLALVCKKVARESILDSYQIERHATGAAVLKLTDFLTRVNVLRNHVAQTVRNVLAPILASQEVIQDRMAQKIAELAVNYRHSPIVTENKLSLVHAKLVGHSSGEQPELGEWFAFDKGPHAGDRAPDAHLQDAANNEHIRLFELLHGTGHHLLLLAGARTTSSGMRSLSEIANSIVDLYSKQIKVHIIARDAASDQNTEWTGSRLIDPDLSLHHKYGASSECLYLIRPDAYIGYRSLPADKLALHGYLETLLI